MTRTRLVRMGSAVALSLVVLAAGAVLAAPAAIPYVGYLSHASSAAPFHGVLSVVALSLWDSPTPSAEAAPVWSGSYQDVSVQHGLMNLVLSGAAGDPLDAGLLSQHASGLWLRIELNGAPMLPLQPVLSVPFALHAANAERLGGASAADYALRGDTLDVAALSVGGDPIIDEQGGWVGPPIEVGVTWTQVSGKPDTATRWPTWGEVTGKPAMCPSGQYLRGFGADGSLVCQPIGNTGGVNTCEIQYQLEFRWDCNVTVQTAVSGASGNWGNWTGWMVASEWNGAPHGCTRSRMRCY